MSYGSTHLFHRSALRDDLNATCLVHVWPSPRRWAHIVSWTRFVLAA